MSINKVGIKLEHCHVTLVESKDCVTIELTTPSSIIWETIDIGNNTVCVKVLCNRSRSCSRSCSRSDKDSHECTCKVPDTKIVRGKGKIALEGVGVGGEVDCMEIRLCTNCMLNPCICSSGDSKAIGLGLDSVGVGVGVASSTLDKPSLGLMGYALGKIDMEPVYFRRLIARYIMGWKSKTIDMYENSVGSLIHTQTPSLASADVGDDAYNLFFPESRPEDDYDVLTMVREKWSASMQEKFREILLIGDGAYYEVGMYSKAALKVLANSVRRELIAEKGV